MVLAALLAVYELFNYEKVRHDRDELRHFYYRHCFLRIVVFSLAAFEFFSHYIKTVN